MPNHRDQPRPISGAPSNRRVYRVVVRVDGDTRELYAERVKPSPLAGFLELEGLLFKYRDEPRSSLAEQRVFREFADVERSHVPLRDVLRVDRVNYHGRARLVDGEGTVAKVAQFPPATAGRSGGAREL